MTVIRTTLAAALLFSGTVALSQQHTHTHGRVYLDVAIDSLSITLQVDSPLESLLGFERKPRSAAERSAVDALVRRLKVADQLFVPDPAASCNLSKVDLRSAVLGLDTVGPASQQMLRKHDERGQRHTPVAPDANEHADMQITVVFACRQADAARHVDVKLFESFKGIRAIDAQLAFANGQSRQTLFRSATRLNWGR